jgi:hypothetical protein
VPLEEEEGDIIDARCKHEEHYIILPESVNWTILSNVKKIRSSS